MAIPYSEAGLNAIMNSRGLAEGSYASSVWNTTTNTRSTDMDTMDCRTMRELMDRYFGDGTGFRTGISTRSKKEKYKKHKIERLILMEE